MNNNVFKIATVIDILKETYFKKLSEDEAYDLYFKVREEADKIATKNNQETIDLEGALGMDNEEYTAFCHALPLPLLAIWRYEGWPTVTIDTKEEIDYKKDYWLVKSRYRKYGLMKIKQ